MTLLWLCFELTSLSISLKRKYQPLRGDADIPASHSWGAMADESVPMAALDQTSQSSIGGVSTKPKASKAASLGVNVVHIGGSEPEVATEDHFEDQGDSDDEYEQGTQCSCILPWGLGGSWGASDN